MPKPANRAEIDARIAALEQQLAQKGRRDRAPADAAPARRRRRPHDDDDAAAANGPPPPFTASPPPGASEPPPVTSLPPPPVSEPAPPPAPSSPADRGRTMRIAGIATAGVGAFMVLIGIIEYGAGQRRPRTRLSPRRRTASRSIPASSGAASRPRPRRRWFLTLGVLAGAGGAALWYYGRHVGAAAESATSHRVAGAGHLARGWRCLVEGPFLMKPVALLASIGARRPRWLRLFAEPRLGHAQVRPEGACPDGYRCADGLTCWQNGQSPGDGGPASDGGPLRDGGGDSVIVNPADKFVGTWTFGQRHSCHRLHRRAAAAR